MRKIKLYIAISLDGYIADKNGGIDWLINFPNEEKTDYGYAAFLETTDTTLIGNQTYKHILQMADTWPYPNHHNYVFTRTATNEKAPYINFISGDITTFAKELKNQAGKDIWLVGGGQLNAAMLSADLIDEMILHIIPVTLGEGLPLFNGIAHQQIFQLKTQKSYNNGVMELHYVR